MEAGLKALRPEPRGQHTPRDRAPSACRAPRQQVPPPTATSRPCPLAQRAPALLPPTHLSREGARPPCTRGTPGGGYSATDPRTRCESGAGRAAPASCRPPRSPAGSCERQGRQRSAARSSNAPTRMPRPTRPVAFPACHAPAAAASNPASCAWCSKCLHRHSRPSRTAQQHAPTSRHIAQACRVPPPLKSRLLLLLLPPPPSGAAGGETSEVDG